MEYLLWIFYIGMLIIFWKLDLYMMDIDCGYILMKSGIKLVEVLVIVFVKEIDMVGDMIVINVDVYWILEGLNLEELVRKILGLEYDD